MQSASSVVFGEDDVRGFDSAKKLAALGFPAGAVFTCGWCDHSVTAEVTEIATAMTQRWPRCHGARMEIQSAEELTSVSSKRSAMQITFEVLPNFIPETIRLKQLLKFALRTLGFRCVDIRKAEDPD